MVDTALFHQLRSRGRGLAQGLLLVLLMTWLAAVCPHCLAEAAPAAPAASAGEPMHCHGGDAPAPVSAPDTDNPAGFGTFDHDGCPQDDVCTGSDCAQLTAVDPGKPLKALIAAPSTPAFVATDFLSFSYPSTPPPAPADAHVLAVAGCPLYLRHCAFLN